MSLGSMLQNVQKKVKEEKIFKESNKVKKRGRNSSWILQTRNFQGLINCCY